MSAALVLEENLKYCRFSNCVKVSFSTWNIFETVTVSQLDKAKTCVIVVTTLFKSTAYTNSPVLQCLHTGDHS